MNQDRIDAERAEIERRVGNFRDMQARFQREREVYYENTIQRVRALKEAESGVRKGRSGPTRRSFDRAAT